MLMTIARVADDIARYDLKKLTDDRTIIRQKTGEDFVEREANGRLLLDINGAAILCGYADLRNAGYPVKLAGTIMSRIRSAMQEHPEANQFVNVTLENGFNFTVAADTVDLSSGFNSGGYVSHAVTIDVRNLRERVRRAMEAENVAA